MAQRESQSVEQKEKNAHKERFRKKKKELIRRRKKIEKDIVSNLALELKRTKMQLDKCWVVQ